MNNKKLLGILALGVLLALAGCGQLEDDNDPTKGAEDLSDTTGEQIDIGSVGESYWFEIGITEGNQQGLIEERPPFKMEDSLERQNLIKRYQYLNDRTNTHHVYMLSHDGKVVNYEVAQGKVSSVNSKLTNDKQIVEIPNAKYDGGNGAGGAEGPNYKVVESPQMDGSYGSNGDAIFFFTTDGHYVEWNGIYVVSEEPKEITSEVTLIDEVEDSSNSTEG